MKSITATVDSEDRNIKAGNKYQCQLSYGKHLIGYIGENSIHEIMMVSDAKNFFDEKDLFVLLLVSE